MIHFSCDLCGKELLPGDEQRYVVKIEAHAAHDPAEITDDDLSDDHLEEVSQILSDLEDNPGLIDVPEPTQHFRFDLCAHCQRRFVRDPLGKKQHVTLFSKN